MLLYDTPIGLVHWFLIQPTEWEEDNKVAWKLYLPSLQGQMQTEASNLPTN